MVSGLDAVFRVERGLCLTDFGHRGQDRRAPIIHYQPPLYKQSATVLNPMLPVELSGVLALRAAAR